jgi:hypothetical protein
VKDPERDRRVLPPRENEEGCDVLLGGPGSALLCPLGHEDDGANVRGNGFGEQRGQERGVMLWIFFADVSRDGLSEHGCPLIAGVIVAEARKP